MSAEPVWGLVRFLVLAVCDLCGWFQLVCERGRGEAAKGRVGAVSVVIDLRCSDAGARVAH
ncbi:MAG: hypothetical protein AAF968_17035, partial [Pseudomonadota bacterium]